MRLIGLFAKIFLFLFILFFIGRASFLITYFSEVSEISLTEVFLSFYHAVPLDISAICFALALPYLMLLFQIFWNKNFLTQFISPSFPKNLALELLSMPTISNPFEEKKDYFLSLSYQTCLKEGVKVTPNGSGQVANISEASSGVTKYCPSQIRPSAAQVNFPIIVQGEVYFTFLNLSIDSTLLS